MSRQKLAAGLYEARESVRRTCSEMRKALRNISQMSSSRIRSPAGHLPLRAVAELLPGANSSATDESRDVHDVRQLPPR